MNTPPIVVREMSLKDAIADLERASNVTGYQIAVHMAKHKPENPNKKSDRPDAYGSTVRRVLAEPDKATWENLRIVLDALGVDAEAALTIAISSAAKVKTS